MKVWLLLLGGLIAYGFVAYMILRIFAYLGRGADQWDRVMADRYSDQEADQ